MTLSYGECNAIACEWERFKAEQHLPGDADTAMMFIEMECSDVYDEGTCR